MTAPTPAIAPSTMSDRKSPGGNAFVATPESQATADEIQSTGTWLQANTAWNITNMMAARMKGPRTGWSRTASRR